MIRPSCPTCSNTHDPAIPCRFAVSFLEQLRQSSVMERIERIGQMHSPAFLVIEDLIHGELEGL